MDMHAGRALLTLALALGLLLIPVAGGYGSEPPGDQARATAEENAGAIDDRFADVARQAPGFGGAFVDEESGTLSIYIVDRTSIARAAAEQALRAQFLPDGLPSRVVALQADYRFLQLKSWYDRVAADVLAVEGVVSTDIDDAANRLAVGVETADVIADVEAQLARNGVPREAVNIGVEAPVTYETSLQNRHRPLVDGLQISFFRGGSQFFCTLGFIAVRQGVTGYVTNSHCTRIQGGVEGTAHYQPSFAAGNRIGVETVDPIYFTGGVCPSGRRCRYSDSSFGRLDSGVTFSRGRIANANIGNPGWGGALYRATSEADAVVGAAVRKVGRTTGQTSGTVSRTCTNFNVSGTNITMLCQSQASYSSMPGDSGSPVFSITNSPLPGDVRLRGIHWGSGGVFSPMDSGIERAGELGTITACASGFGC